jgi:quinolinate synthase
MMKYVKTRPRRISSCSPSAASSAACRSRTPEKRFIGGCRLCPYMKLNSLEKVRDALAAPRPDQIVTLDENLRRRAAAASSACSSSRPNPDTPRPLVV